MNLINVRLGCKNLHYFEMNGNVRYTINWPCIFQFTNNMLKDLMLDLVLGVMPLTVPCSAMVAETLQAMSMELLLKSNVGDEKNEIACSFFGFGK